ncbi:MAG: 8-amino-7-oxononanoate synthase [Planctomycetota bacterium]|nr:MAG: 8-amino-7-oxononanoate synthase [Planctomycetota bacterium]
MNIEDYCNQELEFKKSQNGFRFLKEINSKINNDFSVGTNKIINFCSNDYLGFSIHPAVVKKSQEYLESYGSGSGASPLVCGHIEAHRTLESKISRWKDRVATMLFSSGYAANVGVLSCLMNKGDLILGDKKNHASLIDGCKLSMADFRSYHHSDMASLRNLLDKKRRNYKNALIVSDAVFSMDGDLANLTELCELADEYDCWVLVDEAHATGVIGENGVGLVDHLKLNDRVDLVMGTLSKALGAQGGYITCSEIVKSFLINKCRSYIYSTSLSPAVCGAAIAAIDLVSNDEGHIKKLQNNCLLFSKSSGLKSQSSIFPYIIGDAKETLKAEEALAEKGFFVQSIRPPTVALGTSRLRITIRANHSQENIQSLGSLINTMRN